MPHKFNAARRHKFPKKRYRVTNWAEYTEILRRRGDLTIWVTDDTLKQWRAPRRTTPGGQPKYSNIAIETCLTLRTIYKLPLRQTQGLMRSIARLMGVDIPVPDFSTLSRRGLGLRLPAKPRVDRTEPGSAPGRGVIPTLARAEWSLARSSGEVRAGCWAAMDVLR